MQVQKWYSVANLEYEYEIVSEDDYKKLFWKGEKQFVKRSKEKTSEPWKSIVNR